MLDNSAIPDHSLLAVSGGGDSVALVALTPDYVLNTAVGHVQHGQSEWQQNAAAFVSNLAQKFGRKSLHWLIDCPTRGGQGFEAKARKQRYLVLAELAQANQLTYLITGHTRDDFAETVAIALHRKQGILALAGIPTSRQHQLPNGSEITVFRPLLSIRRNEIRDWLVQQHIEWMDDPTNLDPAYGLRNAIRAEWAKLSETAYSATLQKMEAIARVAAEKVESAQSTVTAIWEQLVLGTLPDLLLDCQLLRTLSDDEIQFVINRICIQLEQSSGALSYGHRRQFAKLIADGTWGARGFLGEKIHYRITKQHCCIMKR